jgi:hypothetical protein
MDARRMHAIELKVHPGDCDCLRSPGCRGKFVVELPAAGEPSRIFDSYDEAEVFLRERALGVVPVGRPGIPGEPFPELVYGRLGR